MDPNPKTFPILSYVMSRLPSLGPKRAASSTDPNSLRHFDLEQPPSPPYSSASSSFLLDQYPHLGHPEVMAAMKVAVSEVVQTRSVLQTLGDRPDHELVDTAKARLAEIEANLAKDLEEIVLSPRPPEADRLEWRSRLADREQERRRAADLEKQPCNVVVQLEEMHDAYEKLLKDAEGRLAKIYDSATEFAGSGEEAAEFAPLKEEVNEEVVGILHEASGKGIERVDLSCRLLRVLPEAFGRLRSLVALNVSSNQLQAIPDSIAGLENLAELYLSSNLLTSLPDSIGLLHKLKILDASRNKLSALPDSISYCRSLVELDVSFNGLTYLPTNIGYQLVDLKKLLIHLNKIRFLPTSICEMRSLNYLDAHFNELHGLPHAIGKLTNLEVLNLSSNFNDLKELPNTVGDLLNLRELDLSNNQIHALPDTFGRLDNLTKLNLDQNPIMIPPKVVADEGVEAVKIFMAKRWIDILAEEEKNCMLEIEGERQQTGWLTRSSSWLGNVVSGVSGTVSGYLGSPRVHRDPYLDQQL